MLKTACSETNRLLAAVEGVQLLRLADRAHALFERQEPAEKRRLLNFLLSNCVWKAGVLTAEYRQPFDMLALARQAAGDEVGESAAKTASFENWLPKKTVFQLPLRKRKLLTIKGDGRLRLRR